MKISQRQQVLDLLNILRKYNFIVTKIDDGGDEDEIHIGSHRWMNVINYFASDDAIDDIIRSVDDCKVYIYDTENHCEVWLWALWGNSPGELIADWRVPESYNMGHKLDKAMCEYFDYYETIESF